VILIVTIPVIIIFMILIGLGSERRAKARWAAMQMLGGRFFEVVRGLTTLRVHDRAEAQVAVLEEVGEAYRRETMSTLRLAFLSALVLELAAALGVAMVAVALGIRLVDGGIGLQASLAVLILAPEIYQPIRQLGAQFHASADGMIAAEEIFAVLDAPAVLDETAGDRAPAPSPAREPIVFDEVGFGYDPSIPVIHGVNLTIDPGETVAFVGPTGAGKSTLAKLIVRFYDPTEGRVLIDGHDLRSVTLGSLRRQLGVVPQEPFLFAGTIRDNIAFARTDATDDEVEEAVRTVGLSDLIERMPNGVDTIVHERGQSLSSGERQLIALARAFLAHPRVLVLDEATSNLDLQSETKIEAALDILLEERTAVLIAHRLSTAMKADRIVVVDEGRIVELGTHDELVARGGRYAEMYATWSSQSHAV